MSKRKISQMMPILDQPFKRKKTVHKLNFKKMISDVEHIHLEELSFPELKELADYLTKSIEKYSNIKNNIQQIFNMYL